MNAIRAWRQAEPAWPAATDPDAGGPAREGVGHASRAGVIRRDCESHRAEMLLVLGDAGLLLGALSLCLGFLALMGLALGVAVWVLSSHDLGRMRAGSMEPAGLAMTACARRRAGAGAALSLYAAVLWGWLLALIR